MSHPGNGIPRVSVLMPVYNAERFLKLAIDSILSQSFSNFELIAINDGSTDSSLDILKSYYDSRIKIISNYQNLGLITTLNKGLRGARAEYVARMDADDISYSDRLSKQVKYLDRNPHVAMVGSWGAYIDEEDFNFSTIRLPSCDKEIKQVLLMHGNCFIHSSVVFRRNLVSSAGGYRSEALHAEDYDLWLRLSDSFALANIPEPLVGYRIHEEQISFKKISQQRKTANMCKRWALERKQESLFHYPDLVNLTCPTLWQRIKGEENTIGKDLLTWSWIYQVANKKKLANKLALLAFIHSPLSVRAKRAAYWALMNTFFKKRQINVLRWYKYRIMSLFKGGWPG